MEKITLSLRACILRGLFLANDDGNFPATEEVVETVVKKAFTQYTKSYIREELDYLIREELIEPCECENKHLSVTNAGVVALNSMLVDSVAPGLSRVINKFIELSLEMVLEEKADIKETIGCQKPAFDFFPPSAN